MSCVYNKLQSSDSVARMIQMAWQDRTPFEVIQKEFGLSENQLKNEMRNHLSPKAYRRWRKRVQGRLTKHFKRLGLKIGRFRGPW